MQLVLMTADFAQVDPAGKVHALGLGWNAVSTPLPPFALIFVLYLEAGEYAGTSVVISGRLLHRNGERVPIGPEGEELEIGAEITISETDTRSTGVLQLGPGLPLDAGKYKWSFVVEGSEANAEFPFVVQDPDQAVSKAG